MALPFFFYGTLMDADIRRVVIGPRADSITLTPARLPGHSAVCLPGRSYPTLRREANGVTEGVLAGGLSAGERTRIDYYESDDYARGVVTVTTETGEAVRAYAYLPRTPVSASATPWDFAEWRRSAKQHSLARTGYYMRRRGGAS